MSIITLHPYQADGKQKIYNDWNSGAQNVLYICPTGGGKSVVTSDIVLDGARSNMQQAVIAHRNELVSQMSMHVANRGIPHRIIGSSSTVSQIVRQHRRQHGRSFVNPSARTAVVGVDTLMARAEQLAPWFLQTERWIQDETHHLLRSNKWGKAIAMMPNARGLGVTATPCRADGQGLGREFDGVFDTMVIGPSMRQLIEWGNLSDYEIVCPESDIRLTDDDLGASGDYAPKKLKAAAEKSRIVGDVVENYVKWATGRKAIVFATDIETGNKIAAKFVAAGIAAANLSSKTPTAVREKYINDFKTGALMVLVNVDLFDEGFDVPACEVVIMARPTASLGKYMQMVGRALRFMVGKVALIIDHVGNIKRHGLPSKHRDWSLARRDKRAKKAPDPDDIPLTVCKSPACAKPYERFHAICPYCGFIPPLPEPRERTIEMVDGDLVLLDRATLERMRGNTVIESPADIAERVAAAAGEIAGKGAANRQREKIEAQRALSDAIAQWAGIGRAEGKSDSELYRRFYLAMGGDVLSVLSADRTRQEYEETANVVRGWYNGRSDHI